MGDDDGGRNASFQLRLNTHFGQGVDTLLIITSSPSTEGGHSPDDRRVSRISVAIVEMGVGWTGSR